MPSPKPINLRGHHLSVVEGYILLRDMEKNYPSSQDLPPHRSNIQRYERIYEGTAMKKAESIAREVIENPAREIKIVRGHDDICAECKFGESCPRGDYKDINQAHEREGIKLGLSTEESRNKFDEERLQEKNLKKGKKYPAYQIFKELKSEK